MKDGYKLRNHPFLHGFALIESYSKKETGEWISVYIIKDVEVNNNMVNLTPCKNILEINRLRNQFLTPHPSALASFARDVYWANFIGLPLSFPECNYRVMPFNPLPREEEDSLEEPIFFSSK
ncbi:MAG: hypothetical protein KGJ02_00845 [Verrucomicrobiota bacterium]|nr:hypothetical protein [Verrucomicrobiota bacterium]